MSAYREPEESSGASLRAAARVLREHWVVIAATTVALLVIALAVSKTSAKVYEATSKVELLTSTQLNNVVLNGNSSNGDPQTEAATAQLLVTSTPVAAGVRKVLGLSKSVSQLLDQVEVSAEPNSYLLDIVVKDSDAARAAQIATAFAQQYVKYRQTSAVSQVSQGEKLLRDRLAKLPSTATADRARLTAALQSVIALEAVQTGDASVVDTAQTPSSASSPRPKRDGLIGALLGVVLGVAIAFLLDLLDRRVKSLEECEELYAMRALTVVPRLPGRPRTTREQAAALEPFRILYNGISLVRHRHDQATVALVTSAVPGEGKTTVALGLARAAALTGQQVVLVEADLRRPSLHTRLELGDESRGLTSALLENIDAHALLRTPIAGLENLKVLPSGAITPAAAELLRPAETEAILASLSQDVDLMVIDSAPLLPVADTQMLLDHITIDTCLIVARIAATTREEARRARAILERRRLTGAGLVVNGLTDIAGGYYYGADEDGSADAGRSASGRSGSAKSRRGKSGRGKSAYGKPGHGKSGSGKPASGEPGPEQPLVGAPSNRR
ncbi:MAG TPA: P-loop NTPase [Solirubrobacteraceae bacterium]|nr:P-loop NTPase [Solirubrobacteraceae bacterium]